MGFEREGECQGRLATELHDHSADILGVLDIEDVFERKRFEVKPVAGVVIRRHGFGIAVDHDRLVAELLQRERRVTAAVIELDALADAVGSAAEDHHLGAVAGIRFALLFISRVHIRREAFELGCAGIDTLEDGLEASLLALGADGVFVGAEGASDALVGEPVAFRLRQLLDGNAIDGFLLYLSLEIDELLDLLQEPGVDLGHVVNLFDRVAAGESEADVVEAIGRRGDQSLIDQIGIEFLLAEFLAGLETADGLRECVLECAADGHDFACTLHCTPNLFRYTWELLQIPAGHFHDQVIQRRLEICCSRACDAVAQLGQRFAQQ